MDRRSNYAVPSVINDDDAHFEACGKRFDDFEKSMNMEINFEARKELIASPAELRDDIPKAWLVFQGNNVVTQNWETALFQDLGSSPASMEAGKAVDAYGCMAGHDIEQADAEQAYVQAYLEGEETWIHLCDEFRTTRNTGRPSISPTVQEGTTDLV